MVTKKLSISAISKASGAVAILGFVAVVAGSSWGLNELKVGGPIYTEIVKAKDVTADILPPPAYIIESFLEVTSAVMDPVDQKAHEERLKVLRTEFDARQSHWLAQDLDPAVKSGLTNDSKIHADEFWKLTEERLLPALSRGDVETAKTIYVDVKRAFEAHRTAINTVVKDAARWSADAETSAANREWLVSLSVWTLSVLVAGIIVVSVLGVSLGIVRPLVRLTGAIQDVAADKLDQPIPYTQNKTEIGAVASALAILRDGAAERQRLEQVARDRLQQDLQRQEALKVGVQKFLDNSSAVMTALQNQTTAMQSSAAALMTASSTSSSEAAGAAKACIEASGNSQAVAAATEELGASIKEIAGQTHRTSSIVADATESAAKTDQDVACFVDVAERIGSIVETIRAIASQTNLLALNATIEAARAGDAGKGFAVVAQEVKALAAQTEKATAEVGSQIDTMQNATRTTVEAVRSIATKIGEINHMTGAIAAAVEEQDSATQEIARRVSMTASGTELAAEKSQAVSHTSERTQQEATSIADGAKELARVTKEIAAAVNEFIGVVGCDLEERRVAARHGANIEAKLAIGKSQHTAIVRDLSTTGAKLSKNVELRPGTAVTLHMAGQSVGAQSVWDADGSAGVTFQSPLKSVEPILAASKPLAA